MVIIVKICIIGYMICGMISCKSAPAPTTEPPGETQQEDKALQPLDDTTRQALAAAQEKVESLRKLTLDFAGPTYYPAECDSAGSHYTQAQALKPTTVEDYKKAIEQYTTLAGEYQALNEKVLPRYVEERKTALQSARNKAVQAGAEDALPEQVGTADETVTEGMKLWDAQEYYAAADAFDDAQNRYGLLETEAACHGLRTEIATYNLSTYDPDTFAAAEQGMQRALSAYTAKDIPAAQSAATEALSQYQLVAATGWEALALERRQRANAERTKALDIKANIAMKNDYEAANGVYSQGDSALSDRDFKRAVECFTPAETMFTVVYKTTTEKRQTAAKTIQAAEKQIVESGDRTKKQAGVKR